MKGNVPQKSFGTKRYIRSAVAITLSCAIAISIYGAVEYSALQKTSLKSIGSLTVTDTDVTAIPSSSSRVLSKETFFSSPASSLSIELQDVQLDYRAHSETTLSDCSVELTVPSFIAENGVAQEMYSITSPITFREISSTTFSSSSPILAGVKLEIPTSSGVVPAAVKHLLMADATSSFMTASLICQVEVSMFGGAFRPSMRKVLMENMPLTKPPSSSSSEEEDDNLSSTVLSPNLSSSSSNASDVSITSDIFSNTMLSQLNLSPLLTSMAQCGSSSSLSLMSMSKVHLSLQALTIVAGLQPTTTTTTSHSSDTRSDSSVESSAAAAQVFASVHMPAIDFHWNCESSSPPPSLVIGTNTQTLFGGADAAGSVRVMAATALRGVLPESMNDLLSRILDADAGKSGINVNSAEPLNIYLAASSPSSSSSSSTSGDDVSRQDLVDMLDAETENTWSRSTSISFMNTNGDSVAAPTPSTSVCTPVLNWVQQLLASTSSTSSSSSSSSTSICQQGVFASVAIQVESASASAASSKSSGSTHGRRAADDSSSSSSPLYIGPPSSMINIFFYTPNLQMDIYNLSAVLSATISMSNTSASFLSQGFANLLKSKVGIWSVSTRMESHISTAWRKTVTDALGNIVSIAPSRTSTLWSTLQCGAATVDISPTFSSSISGIIEEDTSSITSNATSFTIKGSANLASLWSCFDYFAKEYMIGSFQGTPLAKREIAIKPVSLPDQPKGAVRFIFPLLGYLSVPMVISSRRWMQTSSNGGASGIDNLDLPVDTSSCDILPPSALTAHTAQVFKNFLILTDTNCTTSVTSSSSLSPMCNGIDGSKGKLARAYAVSSHPAMQIIQTTPFLDLGCAAELYGQSSPYCEGFEQMWRKNGYTGVDGMLLSGECEDGILHPTKLCLAVRYGSDEWGYAVFKVAAGSGSPAKPVMFSVDAWAGDQGAVGPSGGPSRTFGSVLLRTSSNKNGAGYVGGLRRAYSGFESPFLFRWNGEITSSWSGVRISAVSMFMWVHHYVSATYDPPLIWPGFDALGALPRVDAKACYNPSVGGFDIRANRECTFDATTKLVQVAIENVAATIPSQFNRANGDFSSYFPVVLFNVLPGIVVSPLGGAYSFVSRYVGMSVSQDSPISAFMSGSTANNYLGNIAGRVVDQLYIVPMQIVNTVSSIPIALFGYMTLGKSILEIIQKDLGIKRVFLTAGSRLFDDDALYTNTELGMLDIATGTTSNADFNNFTYTETFSKLNNGTAWTVLHRILCASHGDESAAPVRPLVWVVNGTAGVEGIFTPSSSSGTNTTNTTGTNSTTFAGNGTRSNSGEYASVLGHVSTSYQVQLGQLVEAVDSLISRVGIAIFPGWTNGGNGFTKPVTDFAWLAANVVASPQIFGDGQKCAAFLPRFTGNVIPPAPSASPSPSRRPHVLVSSTPSPSQQPLHLRTMLWVNLAIRIQGLNQAVFEDSSSGSGSAADFLPSDVLAALRADIACALGWNKSYVRVSEVMDEASSARVSFGTEADVNKLVWNGNSNGCVDDSSSGSVRLLQAMTTNTRSLQDAGSTSTSNNNAQRATFSVAVPRFSADGRATGFSESTAMLLQDRAVSLLALVSQASVDASSTISSVSTRSVSSSSSSSGGSSITTGVEAALPAFVSQVSTRDASFHPSDLSVSPLYMPSISVGTTDPISNNNNNNNNNGGGDSASNGTGSSSGAVVAAVFVTGIICTIVFGVIYKMKVKSTRARANGVLVGKGIGGGVGGVPSTSPSSSGIAPRGSSIAKLNNMIMMSNNNNNHNGNTTTNSYGGGNAQQSFTNILVQ